MKSLGFVLAFVVLIIAKHDTELCPDGSSCIEGQTCLQTNSGYGCCPLPNAVSCSDLQHCCPEHHSCLPQLGVCFRGAHAKRKHLSIKHTPLSKAILQPNVCPGGQEQCPEGKTCCPMLGGIFGCCPMPNAVCCSDEIHCCPNGYTCDAASGKCTPGVSKFLQNVSISTTHTNPDNCREGIQCPDDSTCCMMTGGHYGCCPFPRATCSSNMLHCCPRGTQCDVKERRHIRRSSKTPWARTHAIGNILFSNRSSQTEVINDIVCPDGGHCSSGDTCCPMVGGGYGCCPFSQATCCADLLHCCPHGTTCDIKEGRCIRRQATTPWTRKIRAIRKYLFSDQHINDLVCLDGGHCPSGSTCCIMTSGMYGCCSMPQATCCSDKLHCCPHGTLCDIEKGRCIGRAVATPWARKSIARKDIVN